jgi:flagellar basal-body rod protein FlgF/flagellar basal-body rod protein FlgG
MGEKGVLNVSGGKVHVGADGTISVDGAVVGRLKVVDFSSSTQLAATGKTYYSAPENSEIEAKQASVQQGVIESSNVNPVTSAVELINIQRQAEMMQRALSLFNSDFDKTATEDLPRVTS